MSDNINIKLEKAEKIIRKQLRSCIPLSFFALIIPLLAFNSVLLPNGEQPDVWFQRSGSITVMLAVWMEYNLVKANEFINPSGLVVSQQENLSRKYKFRFGLFQYLAAIFAICGTVIWGYGDFFK